MVLQGIRFSAAPILMGLPLGAMVENRLEQSLIIFDHNWLGFLGRPIVDVFLLMIISIATPFVARWRARRLMARMEATSG